MRRWLGLILIGSLAGCAAASTAPPSGRVQIHGVAPAVGTKLVYRITDHGSATREETWTFVDAAYDNRSVLGVSNGVDLMIYDRATGNWIATLRDGKERHAAAPHSGELEWPLWTGKSWRSSFTYHDRERGRSWSPVETWWKVAAYEDVTVPAGTFKALRLESTPGTNNATQVTVWWLPEPRLVVKRVFERTTAHYLGYGKTTTELLKHDVKR